MQVRFADVLELRAADLEQRAMLEDPLQARVAAPIEALVHDRFLIRRLPRLIDDVGFHLVRMRSHGYVETGAPPHSMPTLAERGADVLVADGRLGARAAEALEAEATQRAAEGRFFGHIAYASAIASKRNGS